MSCEIVTSPVTPLFAVDIVNNISLDFAGKVYLDKIYPIAYIGASIKGEATHTFPRVYLNDGRTNYIDVMPDDKLKGMSFFEIESTDGYNREEKEFTMTLNQIFWFNQRKIDDRGYDYKQELLGDVLKTLNAGFYSNEILDITIEENFDNIYSKYTLTEDDNHFFMYPYTGFKLSYEIVICQDLDCIPDFTIQVGGNDC